jgi:nifR3 family TIM-barrel protein
MKFIRPLQIGTLNVKKNIFYAPLAGCSDWPFRHMSAKYNPGLIYCEMVKMDALVRHEPTTYRLLQYAKGMHPIGAQLCGSKLSLAAECAKIIEDFGFDIIDLNCGCPVDKITKDLSGSGLLKFPELIGEILAKMVSSVSIPVTVKIRMGWDEDHIVAPLITRIAEESGAKAICIHGRTRAQGYKGRANWQVIAECKKAAKDILVIGNGDIFSARDALSIFETTQCDAILVARGTLGQPWIVEDIEHLAQKGTLPHRSGLFLKEALLEHLRLIRLFQSKRRAITDLRRVSCWYVKHESKAKQFREQINKIQSLEEGEKIIQGYSWDLIETLSTHTPHDDES